MGPSASGRPCGRCFQPPGSRAARSISRPTCSASCLSSVFRTGGRFGPLSAPHDNRSTTTVGRRRGIVGPLGRRTMWSGGPFPARWAGLGEWLALWADLLVGGVWRGPGGLVFCRRRLRSPLLSGTPAGCIPNGGARTGGGRCARPPATLWDPYRGRSCRDRAVFARGQRDWNWLAPMGSTSPLLGHSASVAGDEEWLGRRMTWSGRPSRPAGPGWGNSWPFGPVARFPCGVAASLWEGPILVAGKHWGPPFFWRCYQSRRRSFC